jgi:hypothetical protein
MTGYNPVSARDHELRSNARRAASQSPERGKKHTDDLHLDWGILECTESSERTLGGLMTPVSSLARQPGDGDHFPADSTCVARSAIATDST